MKYCLLQHWSLLLSPYISTTEHHFCFGPAASFFLELLVIALHSSPVAYMTPSDLRGSSSSVISFCLFCTVHRVLVARILEWVAISSSSRPQFVRTVHYDPSVLGSPAWLAHSFIELCKPLHHDKAVIHDGV